MRIIPVFKGYDFFPHDTRIPFMRYKGLALGASIVGMVLWLSRWFRPDGRLGQGQVIEQLALLALHGVLVPGAPATAAVTSPGRTAAAKSIVKPKPMPKPARSRAGAEGRAGGRANGRAR